MATAREITNHYRREIANRRGMVGTSLPSVRDIASQFGVTTTTAHRAMQALVAEGYIRSEPRRGFSVTYDVHARAILRAPVDGVRMRGEIYAPADRIEILTAALEVPPPMVADVLGIADGRSAVCRRGRVVREGHVLRMGESWFHPDHAEHVPQLLQAVRSEPGSVARIEAVTGRPAVVTADRFTVVLASEHQSEVFGVEKNAPLLERTTFRHDGSAAVEYGRTWFPRNVELVYEFTDPNAPEDL